MGTKLLAALCLDMDDTILAFCASADPCWEGVCAHFAPRLNKASSAELLAQIDKAPSAMPRRLGHAP